ncbi:MAG: family 78 glycoside hydrolase catalytic domain [Candidatus Cyclobacteriaceae bacterium M3_2C_046]
MKKIILYYLLIMTLPGLAGNIILPPHNLKVNYIQSPMGLDDPKPGFSWEIGDKKRGAVQTAYRVLVSTTPELIRQGKGDLWDSDKVFSDQTIQVLYQGKPLKSTTRYYWAAKSWDEQDQASEYSNASWFETGLMDQEDWQGEWITDQWKPPTREEDFYEKIPAPLFRKAFSPSRQIAQARLYISGLGYYEAYLNGQKVGDHRLDPGWTQYAKTVYYATYDVTSQINQGQNVLGVLLGNGWYNPLPMRMFGHNLRQVLTIGKPKVIAQLKLTYTDGSVEHVYTDQTWKTADGPIVKNNIYLGEWYDARLEKEGWTNPGYQDDDWEEVLVTSGPAGDLKWQYIPPVKHTRTVYPDRIYEPQPGMYVVDMGQNFAGVIRFRLNAPAGTEVKFRYAELIHQDRTIDVNTTAAAQIKRKGRGGPGAPEVAWQEDRYITKGAGTEVFEPRFTFHGFRFVEITGLPYQPSLNDLEGLRLNADLADNASFECSNQLFNRVQEVAEWTMLSNVFSIESDCPAREKYGYGGDMVTAGETFLYNYDMSSFYLKSVRDFARDALPDGGMTECAPNIGVNARGVTPESGPPGWTLAHPFLVEQLYRYYGHTKAVQEQYQPMKDLVDFYRSNVPDHIIEDGIGDHVSIDERPRPVTSTAFYYHHARILARMADLLGKKEDAAIYNQLADEIKQAFIREFVNPETGEVFTRTQASQVFALYYDLLPENVKSKALDVLKEEIFSKHRGHLSTGIFSTKMMLNYLSDQGLDEINYTMMNQKEFPGYGYMINNDATTLWENWSFKQHDSKNHPMFGSISEWFHKSLLGIQQSEQSVAFSDIIIKPSLVNGLSWAKGHYKSVRGKIASQWWKFGDDITLKVKIPANTRARIYIPKYNKAQPDIYEGDFLLVQKGVVQEMPAVFKFIEQTNDHVVLETGGGDYHFKVRH